MKKSLFILLLLTLSACGTGSTSTGASSGDLGDPRAAKACVDGEVDARNNGRDVVIEYDNNCSFDINVMELNGDDDSDKKIVLLPANSRVVASGSTADFLIGFVFGACVAPFVPTEFDPFEYRCRMP